MEIPYFQEVILMASTCDACGYRNSKLKAGGAISAKGKKVTLIVRNVEDLSRDVIKSDTASVTIPEIDLELAGGTLGGLVTTMEGNLKAPEKEKEKAKDKGKAKLTSEETPD
ncbi:hypothetical protein L2E82_51175 [Cichorium intybus]|nr:hypothetical protein L2E82_51175 [Cichorium intybus]